MTKTAAIRDEITREVLSWPDVTEAPHRFGGVEFRFHGRELGHLHGGVMADLPFPKSVRDELVAAGRASPHHVLPESGWVTFRIRGPEDVPAVVALFRMQYDRMSARRERAVQASGGAS